MADGTLGPTQTLVLCALDELTDPPTPREIADVVARYMGRAAPDRMTSETEAVQSALARLARRGLAERLGVAASGARTWMITDAGLAALAAVRSGTGSQS